MKEKKMIVLAIYLVLTFSGCERKPHQILNIYEAKDSVKNYHKSGKYLQDIIYQVDTAKKYIVNRLKKIKPNEKLAIVFDIDETLLTQYEYALEVDFNRILLIQSNKNGQNLPLIPVIDLFNFAKEKGLNIFIITGRKEDLKEVTIQNLNNVGLDGWREIYFRSNQNFSSIQDGGIQEYNIQGYKIEKRKKITENGYTIIANIGDQNSDLQGGYAEKDYKLPNHIYLVK